MIATDGVVTLRARRQEDVPALIAGRDDEHVKWLGPGGQSPSPIACVWVDDELVGWVDYDTDEAHDWLKPGEVNVGYSLFPSARGNGYASRAVELLLGHLQRETEQKVATLLIHPENTRSLALARRLGFVQHGEVNGEPFFRRPLR